MKEKYDFYAIGQRKAYELINVELKKYADVIEKEYGELARFEFETGVSSAIPVYGKETTDKEPISKLETIHAVKDYGVENLRNNSYFGARGTSHQYDMYGKYNEPKGR